MRSTLISIGLYVFPEKKYPEKPPDVWTLTHDVKEWWLLGWRVQESVHGKGEL